MTIAVANVSSAIEGLSASSVASSPSFTSTSGNLLVAVGAWWGTSSEGTTPWADGGTNTWTNSKSANVGPGPVFADIAYAKNITGKAGEAATFAVSSAQFPSVVLLEASGCDTTSPNDIAVTYTTATSGTTLASPLVTPAAGDHLLVVVATIDNTVAQSVSSAGTGTASWTTVKNDSANGEPILMAYTIVTANGTDTYGVTYTTQGGGELVVGIAGFKASSGAVAFDPSTSPWALQVPDVIQMQLVEF